MDTQEFQQSMLSFKDEVLAKLKKGDEFQEEMIGFQQSMIGFQQSMMGFQQSMLGFKDEVFAKFKKNDEFQQSVIAEFKDLRTHFDARFDAVNDKLKQHDMRFNALDKMVTRVQLDLALVDSRLDEVDKHLEAHDEQLEILVEMADGRGLVPAV